MDEMDGGTEGSETVGRCGGGELIKVQLGFIFFFPFFEEWVAFIWLPVLNFQPFNMLNALPVVVLVGVVGISFVVNKKHE